MSYASFASPTLPPMAFPIEAIGRRLRLALAVTGMAAQCVIVAGVLWAVLAAPGLLSDRSSTGTCAVHAARR